MRKVDRKFFTKRHGTHQAAVQRASETILPCRLAPARLQLKGCLQNKVGSSREHRNKRMEPYKGRKEARGLFSLRKR